MPVVTALIILTNCFVFFLELHGGDAFVARWCAIPAQIIAGHRWITILSAMFMHASWSHIIGNMIFLWAFGPEIEDAMGRARYLVFYLAGGLVAMLAQIAANPHSTVPNLGASGAIAAVMGAFIVTYPRDRIRSLLFFFIFFRVTFIPSALVPHPARQRRLRGYGAIRRRRLPRPRWRLPLRCCHRASVPRHAQVRRRLHMSR
jgi:membrane associated rhomboid family serine protease